MPVRALLLLPLLLLPACGDAAEGNATPADSATPPAGVVAPRHDTLMSSLDLRCANGTELRANVYVGSEPRVVLATQDTGMSLVPHAAASGTRYVSEDGSIEWWSKGDSGTLTFRGKTTSCGPAEGLEF